MATPRIMVGNHNCDGTEKGFPGKPRTYEVDGKIYTIRDIWRTEDGPEWGDLVRCEYATEDETGIKWTPCPEGVDLASIKPHRILN